MTLTTILADLYRRLNLPTSPASADTTRLTAFVNETHREILTAPGLDRLRDDSITFASVSGTTIYAPGQAIARIKDIYDGSSNYWRLRQLSLNDLRRFDAGLQASGNPEYWVNLGYRQVATKPASATGGWVVSTSTGDVQTAYLEGVRTGGYRSASQSGTLTGLTRAQIGSLTDFIEVDKFYLSSVAIGAVSLYTSSSGGTELARIPIGATQARNLAIQLYPTPSAAVTYTIDYTREILDLVNGTDEPFLPPDFHDLIGLGARTKEYEYRADKRLVVSLGAYQQRRGQLFNWVINTPDYRPRPGSLPERYSNLGGFYPSGIW